ncbi:alcohol dehydrogenase catalytic domain-containing protein [Dactylosporangium sp. AC04546]|uniref:zinc-binding dehydrogenase n=1 Tax=Dactylosporangium sp. AC04546 TaxID=2862460 RepID=UPI001EDF181D|nr:zinc-binding dehydrogenase [Dactylosporangium sp. AC04546]WVK86915.1 alcohol dehydrogenase catalytic domain-containing protein [Dactylosporangium sp. AC04546]
MRAAVLEAPTRPLVVRDIRAADPGPHEVVVRTTASGVCHTDLHVLHGHIRVPVPTVLGHEGAGVVERVGSAVRRVRPGDHVVTSAAAACGSCFYCVRTEPQNCDQMATLSAIPRFVDEAGGALRGFAGLGTFAEMMTVHESSVIPVRTDLPAAQLALVGCGVVTGVGAVVNTARVEPGMTVAVIGCGGVGQSAIQAAALSGAACVVAIDPVELKRESARHIGASVAIAPGDDLEAAIASLTEGRGVDVAIEAVGSAATITAAWAITRRGGTVVVVGAADPAQVVSLSAADLALSRKTMKGSVFAGGDAQKLIPLIVKLAEAGRFDLESLVSKTIRLEDVGAAFEDMEQGRVTRSVIVYD